MDKKRGLPSRPERMTAADRRKELIRILRVRHRETVDNLASTLNVSRRTILRDIAVLTVEYPLETTCGRCGCVYLRSDSTWLLPFLTKSQIRTLKELLSYANETQQKDICDILKIFGVGKQE